jgi:PPM family protein phosphatase
MVAQGASGGVSVAWAAATDVGRVRKLNEDAILAAPPIFAVADGMGGHDAGEVASALAVSRLEALAAPHPSGPLTIDAVAHELHTINDLLRAAAVGPGGPHMGTTVVGLAIVDDGGVPSWLVFNVGDSRAYRYAGDHITQLSRDHSHVQDLVDRGELEPDDARSHPHRNVVTRALGADATVEPDFWVRPVRGGDRFLLCSDGLSGELDDAAIGAIVAAEQSPDAVAAALVAAALDHGGRDNVTVLVLDVVAVGALAEETTETRPGEATSPRRTRATAPRSRERARVAIPGVPRALVRPSPRTTVPQRHVRPGDGGIIDLVPPTGAPSSESPNPVASISTVPRSAASPPSTGDHVGEEPSLISAMPADLREPARDADREVGADDG